jgi:glycosyltransferase involved in cell wall biosynthesis
MILLDAIYINKSGGKVLLEYLVESIVESGLDCHFLIDARLNGNFPQLSADRVTYLESSFLKRYRFYSKHKDSYQKILCFGNIPPLRKCKATVYTYFHQLLFLGLPPEIKGLSRLKFKLKMFVFRALHGNTDYFLVQSENVQHGLAQSYGFPKDRILMYPFYPELTALKSKVIREPNSFIYVSSGAVHKNHSKLFAAFARFYQQHKKGSLTVTLRDTDLHLKQLVEEYQQQNIPINNIGFVPRQALSAQYAKHHYLIYPSLSESFGLGLIEAIQFDCQVLAADLPYSYQVCEPSLTFDPNSEEAIAKAFEQAVNTSLPKTIPTISNRIKDLISILKAN